MKFVFKKDQYRKNRGNYSRLINVICRKCDHRVAVYQKDGSGNLRRMYLYRIFAPDNLNKTPILKCSSCKEILGTLYIYDKEKRKAFRLYQDAVIKKIRKLNG